MNGFGECIPCQAAGMPVMQGARGLAAIVIEPLRGGLANGEGNVWDTVQGAGALGPGALMAGSALYGGTLGGLSAGSWKGAGTGALLASGLTGVGAGVAMLFAPEPVADPTGMSGATGVRMAGALYAALGTAALAWGGYRAYRAIKRR